MLFLYAVALSGALAAACWSYSCLRRERSLRRAAESKVAQSELRRSEIEALARIGNWEFDLADDRIRWSDETFRIFGLTPGEQEPDFADVLLSIHPEDAPRFDRAIQEAIGSLEPYHLDMRITCPDGTQKYIHAQGSPVCDSQSQVVRLIGTVLDITDRKRAETELARQATYDALTGLINRRCLLESLESELASGKELSLCVCDIDKFKGVNDTYGHAAGDEILSGFGQLLADATRRGDISGRLGGDEFCILLLGATAEESRVCIERIRERLEVMAFGMKSGLAYSVTATFGIAQHHPGMTSGELMEAADKALYEAKKLGRNCTVAVV